MMSSEEREGLLKVYVDLPNHWYTGGESLWAKSLGDDLYEMVKGAVWTIYSSSRYRS
jgi:hypothetical protein